MILLGLVQYISQPVVSQLHSILLVNYDFALRSPVDFSVCSPPAIITVRTKRSKIIIRQP